MKKPESPTTEEAITNAQEAFEIIELAIDDLNVLTRAFQTVSEICNKLEEDNEDYLGEEEPSGYFIN